MLKVLIAVATYNRPVITGLCLENLSAFRGPDVRLVAYDDASSAYDEAWLDGYADEVVRFASTGGIARSRARAMRDFVYRFTDFDLLYLTDNDTLHDPGALGELRALFEGQSGEDKLPVSLFSSAFHTRPENLVGDHPALHVTRTIPGVSQGYDRRMAQAIVQVLNHDPMLDSTPGWDFHYVTVLRRACVTTKTSWLEHFARDRDEGGMHAPHSGAGDAGLPDFERDRAQTPTPWLAARRDAVIRKLLY